MRRSVSSGGGLDALRPSPRTIGVASGPCRPASDEPKRRHLLPSPERPCRRPSSPRPRPSAWAGTRRRSNLRSAGVFFLPFALTPWLRRCYRVKRITSVDYIDFPSTPFNSKYFVGNRNRESEYPLSQGRGLG